MARRRGKRRGGRRRRNRRNRRGKQSEGNMRSANRRGEVMVNRTPARMQQMVAPHYYTKFASGFTGKLTGASPAFAYFSVTNNGLNEPFNFGGQSFVDAGAGHPAGTLVGGSVALGSIQPAGVTALSNLYDNYRCYGSSITVTFTPTSGSDILFLCIVPQLGTAPLNDIQLAMAQPYAKFIQCSGNNNIKQNTIHHYMDAATIYGYTKQQYQDDNGFIGELAVGNPTETTLWNVYYQLVSNAVPATAIAVDVRVRWYCELMTPKPNQLID